MYRFTLILIFAIAPTYASIKHILRCDGQLLLTSRDVLISQIGVREVGRNDGPQIREYQRSVGIPPGAPYCAAGQYWCFLEAAKRLGMPTSVIPIVRTGHANTIFNDAMRRGRKTAYRVNIDDLIVWKFKQNSFGHIERIIDVRAGGNVITVGFNTGSDDRDGEGVFKRLRNIYHPIGRMYVRGLVGFEVE